MGRVNKMIKHVLLISFVGLLTSSGNLWAEKKKGELDYKTLKDIKLSKYLKNLEENQTVEKMDSQGKNKPDIFIVFEKGEKGRRQLAKQLFDLNRDGKVDLAKHFTRGKMTQSETDLDYDGKVDVVSQYNGVTGELRKKVQADGKTAIKKYYYKSELRRKELDRNSDGKSDIWIYYRGGQVSRTEIDKNFDGKIIQIKGPLNSNKRRKNAKN